MTETNPLGSCLKSSIGLIYLLTNKTNSTDKTNQIKWLIHVFIRRIPANFLSGTIFRKLEHIPREAQKIQFYPLDGYRP